MPLVSGGVGDGGASMLVTMLKSMLHEYAQRRHSSHEVHGTAALLRPAADGTTTPRRYSEDAQHWIGNVSITPYTAASAAVDRARGIIPRFGAWACFCALSLKGTTELDDGEVTPTVQREALLEGQENCDFLCDPCVRKAAAKHSELRNDQA